MKNLREFIASLRRAGELVQVDTPVNPHLEVAEIHRRVAAADGPALLFTRPVGSDFPLVTNLFGSKRRVEMAFGAALGRFLKDAAHCAETLLPPSAGKIWGARSLLWRGMRARSRRVRRAPVAEISSDHFSLDSLPMLTCWPEDGGAFLTLPLVYTEHPEMRSHNLGMYRMQRHENRLLGLHMQIGKGGGFHHHIAEARQEALPVTVFLGGPPALILAAVAPLPENVGELILAALAQGSPLDLLRSPAWHHPLVAEAEFALCGEVPPGVRRAEGPFGDHYGYYSLRHDYPVFRLQKVLHRKDAIFPATVVGKPKQEDFYIGDYLQEILRPLFPLVMPTVRDLWSYGETGYHSLSAAVVRDRYPREAMASAFRILGEGQLSLTKFLLLTDTPQDLRNFRALLAHILERADFTRDLLIFDATSMDTLDYNGPRINEGSKGVLMGLGPPRRKLPAQWEGELPPEVAAAIPFTPGCLVIEADPARLTQGMNPRQLCAQLARLPCFDGWPLLVLVDDAEATAATCTRFLWTVFTRIDPAADFHAREVTVERLRPRFGTPVLLDARKKPEFPRELFADESTARQVANRWREYFPGGQAMGESGGAHLDNMA